MTVPHLCVIQFEDGCVGSEAHYVVAERNWTSFASSIDIDQMDEFKITVPSGWCVGHLGSITCDCHLVNLCISFL